MSLLLRRPPGRGPSRVTFSTFTHGSLNEPQPSTAGFATLSPTGSGIQLTCVNSFDWLKIYIIVLLSFISFCLQSFQ